MSLSRAEHLVQNASARGVILTLTVSELKPRRVLEILAEGGHSHRVSIQTPDGCFTIELGNGLVVGAEAVLEGEALTGRDAYALLREIDEGSLRIEPLRFPSLANILQPVAELPDFMESIAPATGDDTIELSLPEARPIHPPPTDLSDPTSIEIVLPEEELAAPTALTIAVPPPEIPEAQPLEASPNAPSPGRPSIPAVAAAAALLLAGVSAGAFALGVPLAESAPPVATPTVLASPTPTEPANPEELPEEVDMNLSRAEVDRHAARLEARRLARMARDQIRRGERAQALVTARQAADLRGGLPYYQVLLGDALAANDRRAAARRAYRRALRLRPGYPPATRRLERRPAAARRAART